MVYTFNVSEQKNAKAFVIWGQSADKKKKVCVATFYYDFGVPKEVIQNVSTIFAHQLNESLLEIEE